jgi:hypothetical protein
VPPGESRTPPTGPVAGQALGAPVLIHPKKGEVVPQPYAAGSWEFKWEEPGKSQEVLQYQLMIVRGTGQVVRDIKLEKTDYALGWRSRCVIVRDQERHGFKWRVRAQDKQGDWSPWSEASFEVGPFDEKVFAEKCPGALKPAAAGAPPGKSAALGPGTPAGAVFSWKTREI